MTCMVKPDLRTHVLTGAKRPVAAPEVPQWALPSLIYNLLVAYQHRLNPLPWTAH